MEEKEPINGAIKSKPTKLAEDIRKKLKNGITYNDFVKDWMESGWLMGISLEIDCLTAENKSLKKYIGRLEEDVEGCAQALKGESE